MEAAQTQPTPLEANVVELGGKRYELRIEFGAVSMVAKAFPEIDPATDDLRYDPRILMVRLLHFDRPSETELVCRLRDPFALHVLLWAALQYSEPGITFERTAELINEVQARSGQVGLTNLAQNVWAAAYAGGLGSAGRADRPNAEAGAVGAN